MTAWISKTFFLSETKIEYCNVIETRASWFTHDSSNGQCGNFANTKNWLDTSSILGIQYQFTLLFTYQSVLVLLGKQIGFLLISDMLIFSNGFWPVANTNMLHTFPSNCKEPQVSHVVALASHHAYSYGPLADSDIRCFSKCAWSTVRDTRA